MSAPLPLGAPTPPRWGEAAARHLDTLLLDQAHLEKKAAAAANAFLFRLPTQLPVHRALSRLAREELLHFERTLQLLERRALPLQPLQPGPYAERLKTAVASQQPLRLCDELLLAAIIEARSHERMAALADALPASEAAVAAFYRDLVAAEARHAEIYSGIARLLFDAGTVEQRWQRLAAHEAELLSALPFAPRLHSGIAEPLPGGMGGEGGMGGDGGDAR